MVDVDKLTKDTLSKGGVLALLYFDLHASTKEVIEDLGSGFVQKLLKEPGVVYALGEIDEPIPTKDNKFLSSSIEVKILTDSFLSIHNICASYSPFSLEILKPNEIKLTIDKAHEVLMSMSATTYEYKKHIIEKMSTKEDLERYRKTIEQKIHLGKKISEKKGEKDA